MSFFCVFLGGRVYISFCFLAKIKRLFYIEKRRFTLRRFNFQAFFKVVLSQYVPPN